MRGAMGGGNPADPETVALIRRLEEALLVPEVRKSAAQIAALLADEFVEIGSSGQMLDDADASGIRVDGGKDLHSCHRGCGETTSCRRVVDRSC